MSAAQGGGQETGARLMARDHGGYYPAGEWWGSDAQERALTEARARRFTDFRVEQITRPLPTDAPSVYVSGDYWFFSPATGGYVRGSAANPAVERKHAAMDEDEATPRQQGEALGRALARLIGPGATADWEALTTVGMMFAELKNFRDLRSGSRYTTAFIGAFQAVVEADTPKRIETPPP